MKKKICSVLLLIVGLYSYNVSADCSYKEQAALNSEVAHIKANYEEAIEMVKSLDPNCEENAGCEIETYYFNINILNLSENFNIKVKNNVNKDSKTITYKDVKDGIVTFPFKDILDITTFTFDIFTSENTMCPNKKMRTMKLTTPRYNRDMNYAQCSIYPDYYLCQKYVTFAKMDTREFSAKLNDYVKKVEEEDRKNDKKSLFGKIYEFIDNHKLLVLATILVIGASAGGTTYLVIKKRKKGSSI